MSERGWYEFPEGRGSGHGGTCLSLLVASLDTFSGTSQTLLSSQSSWTTRQHHAWTAFAQACRVLTWLHRLSRLSRFLVVAVLLVLVLPRPLCRLPLVVFLRVLTFALFVCVKSPYTSLKRPPFAQSPLGSPHSGPTSTWCPSADGTIPRKTVARSSLGERVTASTGRSRGDGHGCVRLLSSLPAESGKTDGSCEWPLCKVPLSLFFPLSRVFLRSVTPDTLERWQTVLGWSRAETPPVVPVRGHLEGIRRLMKGDNYVGRGCRQRGLQRSVFGNPHKVSVYGRARAVRRYAVTLARDEELRAKVWSLAGCRLLCHCTLEQECHADVITAEYGRQFPDAHDRDGPDPHVPSSSVLNLLSRLREEPDSSDGSSADEAAPRETAGWRGTGKPMEVGLGYTSQEISDGQGLASPGRGSPEERRYPDKALWKAASEPIIDFTRRHGTTALLTRWPWVKSQSRRLTKRQ